MDAVTAVVPIGGVARLGSWLGRGVSSIRKTTGVMTNQEVRLWYNNQIKRINTNVKPTKYNAKKISKQRAYFKRKARRLMSDQGDINYLNKNFPVQNYNYYYNKYYNQGFRGKSLYERIIQGSKTPNSNINKKFGIN